VKGSTRNNNNNNNNNNQTSTIMKITVNQTTAKHFIDAGKLRPAMGGIYFDCEAKKIVMTNGHVLLTVNFEPDPEMASFIAPLSALPKKKEAEITFDGNYIRTIEPGQATTVTEPIAEFYPAWRNVMPDALAERPGINAIGVNPSLFAGFAAVVKNLGGLGTRMDFWTAGTAIKVTPITPAEWEGLIMPVRIEA
jgi:hypothetical protein